MKRIIVFITIIFLSCIIVNAQQLCFNSNTLTPNSLESQPNADQGSMTHGDFNGDGNLDLVVTNRDLNNISVFLGNGDATFASAVNYNVGVLPKAIQTADFNEDGLLDLVVANYNSNNISILLGTGNGVFSNSLNYLVGTNPCYVVCKDFNGDSHVDLAVANNSSSNTSILFGDGLGIFSTSSILLNGTNPRSLASSDFNNDGKYDLAIVNTSNVDAISYLSIFIANGLGGFGAATTYSIELQASSIVSSDFNNDGISDLAITNFNSYKKMDILIGNGTGGFTPPVKYNTSQSGSYSLIAADFNNDGKLDLLNSNYSSFSIYTGKNNGTFSTAIDYPGIGITTEGDFNNDGNLDIAIKNHGLSILNICAGNGNGNFDLPTTYIQDSYSGIRMGSFVSCNMNSDDYIDFITDDSGEDSLIIIKADGLGTYSSVFEKHAGSGSNYPYTLTGTYFVTSADFNNDNKPDIAFTGQSTSDLYYLVVKLGNGTGGFVATNSYMLPALIELGRPTTADYNHDGNIDIFISAPYSQAALFLGNGQGAFTLQTTYTITSAGSHLYEPISTDLNNDGNIDFVVGVGKTPQPPFPNYFVASLLGNGSGGFTLSNFSITASPEHIVATDFNKDGKTDLAVSNGTLNSISVFLGNGSGFSPPINYQTGGKYITKLLISDFDNDGNLDIASVNLYSANISFFLGQGNGGFFPAINYNVGSTVADVIASDLNKDGLIDMGVLNINGITILLNRTTSLKLKTTACIGLSAILQASKGADSYLWNPNFSSADTMAISVNGTYSVTINYMNSTCGVSTSSINVNFYPLPIINVVASQSLICAASTNSLTASGAMSYYWNTGQTSLVAVVAPTITTVYSVTGTDSNNCSNTQTVSVIVDPTCQDVWPGDVNSDGLADNLDVLELGLHYTQTGAPRASISNAWQPYFSNNWAGTITNGKNLNHSDCNGDGIVDDNDTLAIYNNYGLTHAFKPAQTNTVNPQLSIVPDQADVAKGNWGTASIYLGDVTTSINNINGIAFTVDFDNTLIEPNSIYVEYQNSFLDAGQNLHFRKLDFANGKLFTATTHTVNNNVNGYGKIATLHYQIKSTLTTDQVLNIGISQADQSNAFGIISPLTSGSGSLTASIDVGLKEFLNSNSISINPNPTNGSLTINSKTELQKIEILSITGQVLLSEMPTNVLHTLHLDNFANGIYFVNVYQSNRIVKREKIVLNK
ncbi:MAG: T9SS type A sorting domain-containing protein [Bacteroidia bacterium]|nr:T9SS type A sorting domain-containing protein [Bacteroidia bacterium]